MEFVNNLESLERKGDQVMTVGARLDQHFDMAHAPSLWSLVGEQNANAFSSVVI